MVKNATTKQILYILYFYCILKLLKHGKCSRSYELPCTGLYITNKTLWTMKTSLDLSGLRCRLLNEEQAEWKTVVNEWYHVFKEMFVSSWEQVKQEFIGFKKSFGAARLGAIPLTWHWWSWGRCWICGAPRPLRLRTDPPPSAPWPGARARQRQRPQPACDPLKAASGSTRAR